MYITIENIIGEKINRFLKEIDWNALMVMDFDAWEGFSRQEIEVFYPKQRVLTFYLFRQNKCFSVLHECCWLFSYAATLFRVLSCCCCCRWNVRVVSRAVELCVSFKGSAATEHGRTVLASQFGEVGRFRV